MKMKKASKVADRGSKSEGPKAKKLEKIGKKERKKKGGNRSHSVPLSGDEHSKLIHETAGKLAVKLTDKLRDDWRQTMGNKSETALKSMLKIGKISKGSEGKETANESESANSTSTRGSATDTLNKKGGKLLKDISLKNVMVGLIPESSDDNKHGNLIPQKLMKEVWNAKSLVIGKGKSESVSNTDESNRSVKSPPSELKSTKQKKPGLFPRQKVKRGKKGDASASSDTSGVDSLSVDSSSSEPRKRQKGRRFWSKKEKRNKRSQEEQSGSQSNETSKSSCSSTAQSSNSLSNSESTEGCELKTTSTTGSDDTSAISDSTATLSSEPEQQPESKGLIKPSSKPGGSSEQERMNLSVAKIDQVHSNAKVVGGSPGEPQTDNLSGNKTVNRPKTKRGKNNVIGSATNQSKLASLIGSITPGLQQNIAISDKRVPDVSGLHKTSKDSEKPKQNPTEYPKPVATTITHSETSGSDKRVDKEKPDEGQTNATPQYEHQNDPEFNLMLFKSAKQIMKENCISKPKKEEHDETEEQTNQKNDEKSQWLTALGLILEAQNAMKPSERSNRTRRKHSRSRSCCQPCCPCLYGRLVPLNCKSNQVQKLENQDAERPMGGMATNAEAVNQAEGASAVVALSTPSQAIPPCLASNPTVALYPFVNTGICASSYSENSTSSSSSVDSEYLKREEAKYLCNIIRVLNGYELPNGHRRSLSFTEQSTRTTPALKPCHCNSGSFFPVSHCPGHQSCVLTCPIVPMCLPTPIDARLPFMSQINVTPNPCPVNLITSDPINRLPH